MGCFFCAVHIYITIFDSKAMNKFLIVGLGNIGEEYNFTRHNIGFDVVDVLAAKYNGSFKLEKLAWRAEIKIKNKIGILIKPTTYMNLSGKAFKYWMDAEKISVENTMTVVDELALPLDTLRIRGSGSDAGHNGLKDIQLALGHNKYPKLRFGIGNDFAKGQQIKHVLGKWKDSELEMVKAKILLSVEAIETFMLVDLTNAMNTFNSKTV
jgi:peptidyl-tRNA hydrolase, PTH1 family